MPVQDRKGGQGNAALGELLAADIPDPVEVAEGREFLMIFYTKSL